MLRGTSAARELVGQRQVKLRRQPPYKERGNAGGPSDPSLPLGRSLRPRLRVSLADDLAYQSVLR